MLGKMAERPLVNKAGWVTWLPGLLGGWTQVRDLHEMPKQTFREWFEQRQEGEGPHDGK